MADIFLKIFNISVTASYLVLAVLLLRLLLKKAPRWSVCLLWGIVALRLIMPFSLESRLSLIPSANAIVVGDKSDAPFEINTGVTAVDAEINDIIIENKDSINEINQSINSAVILPDRDLSVLPNTNSNTASQGANLNTDIQPKNKVSIFTLFSFVWVAGIATMLLYSAISIAIIRKRVKASIRYKDNIYFCDNIDTSFILGIFCPKIYIQSDMSQQNTDYVIRHEQAHIKRCDYLLKPFAFLLLSVYWFNPLMWVSYILLCRDIESACDQKVIKDAQTIDIKGYSTALLSCGTQRKMIIACPVAFGEVSVKSRIKAVLKYKRTPYWVSVIAVALCSAVACCFLTNPIQRVDAFTSDNEENAEYVYEETTSAINTERNTSSLNSSTQDSTSSKDIESSDSVSSFENEALINNNLNDYDDIYIDNNSSINNSTGRSYRWVEPFETPPAPSVYNDRVQDKFKYYRSTLNTTEKQIYDTYLPYILSYTPFYIDFETAEYDWPTFVNAMDAIQYDYPETWYYLSLCYDYDITSAVDADYKHYYYYGGCSNYYTINYSLENIENFDKIAVQDYINQINAVCDDIIGQMPQDLTKKEKYKWLADYLCDYADYWYRTGNNFMVYEKHSHADGVLLYGNGRAGSFAEAYQWLCQNAGLEATVCESLDGGWNSIVLEDGQTYYMYLCNADIAKDLTIYGIREEVRENYYFLTYEECLEKQKGVTETRWYVN